MSNEPSIVLAAGGTGGHMFPAFSLADELISRGYKVYILTDERGARYNHPCNKAVLVTLALQQKKGSILQQINALISLVKSSVKAIALLKNIQPQVVIGFGGYVSLPTLLAALWLKIPTIVHQADAFLGKVNRLLAPYVKKIATSFPHVAAIKESWKKKVVLTGLPLREEFLKDKKTVSEGITPEGPIHLLVIGGSQGARILGETVPRAIALLPESLQKRIHVMQQVRDEFIENVRKDYAKTYAQVEIASFFKNIGECYRKTNLIISRSGASSALEIFTMGKPAIFIPYQYAADDHQRYNAEAVVKAGGGWIMSESELKNPLALSHLLHDLFMHPEKLVVVTQDVTKISTKNATKNLADVAESLVIIHPQKGHRLI